MATCSRCLGEGSLRSTDPHEVERDIQDPCYHCGTTGEVDGETEYYDRLMGVVALLAAAEVKAWRDACNEDPEGEGWAFRAAESMMTEYDYTMVVTWEKQDKIAAWMESLSSTEKEFMLSIDDPQSWHTSFLQAEMDRKSKARLAAAGMKPHYTFNSHLAEENEIPF